MKKKSIDAGGVTFLPILIIIIFFLILLSNKGSEINIKKKNDIFVFELEILRLNVIEIDSVKLVIGLNVFEAEIDVENEKIITKIAIEKLFIKDQTKNIFRLQFQFFMENKTQKVENYKVILYKRGKYKLLKGD